MKRVDTSRLVLLILLTVSCVLTAWIVLLRQDLHQKIEQRTFWQDQYTRQQESMNQLLRPPAETATRSNRLVVKATVVERSAIKSLEGSEYKDAFSRIRLRLDEVVSGSLSSPFFIATVRVCTNRTLQAPASWQKGQSVVLKLIGPGAAPNSWKTMRVFDDITDLDSPLFYADAAFATRQNRLSMNHERQQAIEGDTEHIKQLLLRHAAGSWDLWAQKTSAFRTAIRAGGAVTAGWTLNDDTRSALCSLNYDQTPRGGPSPRRVIADIADQLEQAGIDFIYLPLPTKADLYPENFSASLPTEPIPVTPARSRYLYDLLQEGVEVIDVLPRLNEEKINGNEVLFFPGENTHLTNRGLQVIADQLSERLHRYAFIQNAEAKKSEYTIEPVPFVDLFGADGEAHRIRLPNGSYYQDDSSSPLLLVGDSNLFYWQTNYSKNAGLAAQLAVRTGLTADTAARANNGMQQLLREFKDRLTEKKVVIYIHSGRALWNHGFNWEPVNLTPYIDIPAE